VQARGKRGITLKYPSLYPSPPMPHPFPRLTGTHNRGAPSRDRETLSSLMYRTWSGRSALSFFSSTAPSAAALRARERLDGESRSGRFDALTMARPSKSPAANLARRTLPAARSRATCRGHGYKWTRGVLVVRAGDAHPLMHRSRIPTSGSKFQVGGFHRPHPSSCTQAAAVPDTTLDHCGGPPLALAE
jgi:hypothetical protein